MKRNVLLVLCLLAAGVLGALAACQPEPEPDVAAELVVATSAATAATETPRPTETPQPTVTPRPTTTPTATTSPTPTVTPSPISPYAGLTDDEKMELALFKFLEAQQLAASGDYEEAIVLFDELAVLGQELGDEELVGMVHYFRGSLHAGTGDFVSAVTDFEAALTYEPDDPIAHNNLCWYYGLLSEPEKGLPHCDQAIILEPSYHFYDSRGLVHALLGNYAESAADFQVAVNDLASSPYPAEREMRAERGIWVAILSEGQNPIIPEVLHILENEEPLDRVVPDEAIVDLPLLQALNHFWIARDHHNQKRWAEAIAAYSEAITRYPEFAEAYYFRGIAHRLDGEEALAIADYEQAIALNPEHAPAYHLRGLVLGSLGDYEGAIESYARAIEIDPVNPDYHRVTGTDLMALGRNEEALESLDRALELNPGDPLALMSRGVVRYELGSEQEAFADLEMAFDLGLIDLDIPQEAVDQARDLLTTLRGTYGSTSAALAAIPDVIMALESLNLPAEFVPMSPDNVGVAPGQTAYTHWESGGVERIFEVERSFAFADPTGSEMIFGYLLTLTDDSARQIMEEAIVNLLVQSQSDFAAMGLVIEEAAAISGLEDVGEQASGSTLVVASATPPLVFETLMFRQGDVLGTIYHTYEADSAPAVRVDEAARALVALLNSGEQEPEVSPGDDADS